MGLQYLACLSKFRRHLFLRGKTKKKLSDVTQPKMKQETTHFVRLLLYLRTQFLIALKSCYILRNVHRRNGLSGIVLINFGIDRNFDRLQTGCGYMKKQHLRRRICLLNTIQLNESICSCCQMNRIAILAKGCSVLNRIQYLEQQLRCTNVQATSNIQRHYKLFT